MSGSGGPGGGSARLLRERLTDPFAGAAEYYEARAAMQRVAARRLVPILRRLSDPPPSGPILEVGCGTGFVSRELLALFPNHRLELTDLSDGMVRHCRNRFSDRMGDRLTIEQADGEKGPPAGREGYGLIVAALVAQWFDDPAAGLVLLAGALKPGGTLVASIPGSDSFPEWRRAGERAGVRYTARPLPEGSRLVRRLSSGSLQPELMEERHTESHESPLHFFRHLRRMGAAGGAKSPPLSPSEFRRLLRSWHEMAGDRTEVTYQLLFLTLRKEDPLPSAPGVGA